MGDVLVRKRKREMSKKDIPDVIRLRRKRQEKKFLIMGMSSMGECPQTHDIGKSFVCRSTVTFR